MEQTLPIEECARQRLQVMVYAFTMFTKNLMEEGVDRDKVKNASDTGAIAEEVHGIEVTREASEHKIRSKFIKCPWHEASSAIEMPEDWRFCASGHAAFTGSMYKGLDPGASYELPKTMPEGAAFCEGISKLG
jgi:hypothetical protein